VRAIIRIAAFPLLMLAGCGGDESTEGRGESFVSEEFCRIEGLPVPTRHTFILVDGAALAHTEDAEQFVASNRWVREATFAIADPERAINSGASEPRERISVIRLPEDGSVGTRVFTGCIPAMTGEEMAQANERGSRLGIFFGGGPQDELNKARSKFRRDLAAALQAAARSSQGRGEGQRGPLAQSRLFTAIRSSAGLLEAGQNVPRLVLITNLAHTQVPGGNDQLETRRAGFLAGMALGLNLGGSEIVLIQPGSSEMQQRIFLDSFLLAQRGHLIYAGDGRVSRLPAAPQTVRRFIGQAAFPEHPENVQIRIAIDRNGRLINSWITLRDQNERSIPLSGQASCDEAGLCTIRSENDGFGQTWSLSPGGQPEFGNEMPFGGARNFELRLDREGLNGRVFDPLIDQFGANADNTAIPITARVRGDATF
jgi:hypothetical protein